MILRWQKLFFVVRRVVENNFWLPLPQIVFTHILFQKIARWKNDTF